MPDALKARFLPQLASGESLVAFALSESDAGSDPLAMRMRARRERGEWVLNGTKNWITNAGVADLYVVFAVTHESARAADRITAFVVPGDAPGLTVSRLEHKMGMRGSPTGQPVFEDVRSSVATDTSVTTRSSG